MNLRVTHVSPAALLLRGSEDVAKGKFTFISSILNNLFLRMGEKFQLRRRELEGEKGLLQTSLSDLAATMDAKIENLFWLRSADFYLDGCHTKFCQCFMSTLGSRKKNIIRKSFTGPSHSFFRRI